MLKIFRSSLFLGLTICSSLYIPPAKALNESEKAILAVGGAVVTFTGFLIWATKQDREKLRQRQLIEHISNYYFGMRTLENRLFCRWGVKAWPTSRDLEVAYKQEPAMLQEEVLIALEGAYFAQFIGRNDYLLAAGRAINTEEQHTIAFLIELEAIRNSKWFASEVREFINTLRDYAARLEILRRLLFRHPEYRSQLRAFGKPVWPQEQRLKVMLENVVGA